MTTDNSTVNINDVQKAALQFGTGNPSVKPLGNGLINHTYLVHFPSRPGLVIQLINQATFPQPEKIMQNYRRLQNYLSANNDLNIPPIQTTTDGKDYWLEPGGRFWRSTLFIENSYAIAIPSSAQEAFTAAKSFAAFTRSLNGLPANEVNIIISSFHDLAYRYNLFEETVKKAHITRLLKSTHVISEIRDRVALVDFYNMVAANEKDYPTRIMHHDCKISNVLFDKTTNEVICPVDLDTVMPGKYFSDLGDMIRTMACTEEENSVSWETIGIKPDYYTQIINGYLRGIGDNLTPAEMHNIHQPGLLLTYMQCIRFVTDFLNNDIYYKTDYPEQNLNRALNQLILLEKLENFIAGL